MAILDIKKFDNPVLRKKCKKIEKVDKEVRKLAVDMAQTMEKSQGVGLAAPQVGISKQVIVVLNPEGRRILALINPEITKRSEEKEKDEEGCLSFPGIYLGIKRARDIVVKGLDINGEEIEIKAEGFLARVFQHETDHLKGILFFHRLSFLERIIFKLKHFSIKVWS